MGFLENFPDSFLFSNTHESSNVTSINLFSRALIALHFYRDYGDAARPVHGNVPWKVMGFFVGNTENAKDDDLSHRIAWKPSASSRRQKTRIRESRVLLLVLSLRMKYPTGYEMEFLMQHVAHVYPENMGPICWLKYIS